MHRLHFSLKSILNQLPLLSIKMFFKNTNCFTPNYISKIKYFRIYVKRSWNHFSQKIEHPSLLIEDACITKSLTLLQAFYLNLIRNEDEMCMHGEVQFEFRVWNEFLFMPDSVVREILFFVKSIPYVFGKN